MRMTRHMGMRQLGIRFKRDAKFPGSCTTQDLRGGRLLGQSNWLHARMCARVGIRVYMRARTAAHMGAKITGNMRWCHIM